MLQVSFLLTANMRFDFYGVFFESHPKHVRETESSPNKSFDVSFSPCSKNRIKKLDIGHHMILLN